MSVLLIDSEIFGTQGMEIVDVQLRSNGAWFLIRVFLHCWSSFLDMNDEIALNRFSSFQVFGVEHNLCALRKRPLINPCFISDECQKWKFEYLPAFVGFQYAVVLLVPFIRRSLDVQFFWFKKHVVLSEA